MVGRRRVGRRLGDLTGLIGTLNEGSLHAQLKEWYRQPGDLLEHPVDGFLIDVVRGETLIDFVSGFDSSCLTDLRQIFEISRSRLRTPASRV